MDYPKLRAVLDADPATFGALSDADAAVELNAVDKSFDVPIMSGKEVKENIDATEWAALADPAKQIVLALVARDDLDPHGVDASIFLDAMPSGANPITTAALNASRTLTRSTADINGLGTVLESHVAVARAL